MAGAHSSLILAKLNTPHIAALYILKELRLNLEDLIPHLEKHDGINLIKAAIELYSIERIDGANSIDEDMLLFQWGLFDWGEGEYFELDITRQISPTNTDEIRQLSCTLYFNPSTTLLDIEEGNRWCSSLEELKSFCEFVLTSRVFKVCSTITPEKSSVELEYV